MYRLYLRVLVLLFIAPLSGASIAEALSGYAAAELRLFANEPTFPEQDKSTFSPSVALEPEYLYEWNNGNDRLTVVPFLRVDADDDERTHADLRELNWLHIGSDWDLRLGIGKVFWGVTESRHLVDIINQTDFVENVDGEDKLGQPMMNLNLLRDWGSLRLFVLPGFRERTFPGREGRFRSALPVDTSRVVFESSAEQKHTDLALRWSHSVGDWDIGLAHFWGTSRDPRLQVVLDASGQPVLVPHYDIIHQTSLDVQATKGSWLWKLEAISQEGQEGRFAAMVAGFEYTFYGVMGTGADLGILSEYLYDGRNEAAPATPFDDDIFVGARLAFNDLNSTQLLIGAIVDRDNQANLFSVEASRRIGDRWVLELEARIFDNVSSSDILFGQREDDFLQLRLKRFF